MSDEIKWRYWETNDSEYGRTFIGDMMLTVRDCDGDFSMWNIKIGDKYLASGQANGNDPYHFDRAKEKSEEVANYLCEASELIFWHSTKKLALKQKQVPKARTHERQYICDNTVEIPKAGNVESTYAASARPDSP